MRCQEAMELIQRDMDNDLLPLEKDKLNAHLLTCVNCKQWQEKLHSVSTALENLPDVEPPYSLVDRMMPHIDAEEGQQILKKESPHIGQQADGGWTYRYRSWLVAAGVAACLFLIVSIQTFVPDTDVHLNSSEYSGEESLTPMSGDNSMDRSENAPATMDSNNTADDMDTANYDDNTPLVDHDNEAHIANNANSDQSEPTRNVLFSPTDQFVAVHETTGVYVYGVNSFYEENEKNEESDDRPDEVLVRYEQAVSLVLRDWMWESNDTLVVIFIDENGRLQQVEMNAQAQQVTVQGADD